MVTNFKKSFLLLITAIFFAQSLILGCSTEVDSEVKKMEEEEQDVITVVKKTHSVQGIPDSWATTDVYAYAYDNNGNKILIPVSVKDGVATFEADETYTKCVLVSLPKGTNVSAYTAKPLDILNADCQKSEVIDLTKDSLSFVLAKSDYIGTWNSLTDKLVINEEGTFSLDIGNDDSVDCAGTYVDTKTGVKASYSKKVDGTDVSKNIEFTKQEADVLLGSVNEKETYFVKSTNETPNLNGTWKNSDETTTTIINNESKKIYVEVGETKIWGTIVQVDNTFVLKDEESNVIGTGFVSAAGNAYIYNEATGTYEIFTRNGSATESDSKIPSKMFTVTYKSELADDDVQEKAEGTVLELQTPSHKGYRFDGWYTDEGKTAKAKATYTIAENLTFYAKWVQQVTVKFTSAQSEHADKVVDIGTEITIEDPAKEKFDFDGWFIGETKVSGKYTVTKDVELVAKWTALYNVTYETDGTPVKPETVRAGTEITFEPTTHGTYEFECWMFDNETYKAGDKYIVNSDVKFVVKWKGLCTITYSTDGGETIVAKSVSEGSSFKLPEEPTRDGYVFKGWYLEDENNLLDPGELITVTENLEIKAKWVKLYTYKYDNTEYVKVEEGTKITIDDAPEAEGCTFAGWSDGTNTYQPDDEYEITSDVEFTAIWNVTVTFVSEHTEHEAVTIKKGSTLDLPNPIVEGYDFDGWFNEGDEKVDSPYTVDANIQLTAKWTKLWTVTYMSDGDEIASEIVRDGESIVLKAPSIEKTGYTFHCWEHGEAWIYADSSKEITADITLTARWTKDPVAYSISGVPTTGWGLVEVYVYNEAEGRENGTLLGYNHSVNKETGIITFETAKDITHCILVSFGDPDPNSEMPPYSDLEDLLNVSSTYSEDLDVTDGSAVFVQYVPKVTYTIKNAEGYSTPYVTIDGEEVASVYDSETKTVTFEYAEGLTGCLIAKDDSHSAEKEIIFDENGIGMINSQYSFVIDPNQVYFRNSKSWHGGIQVYAWHSSNPENVVRIDMTKAADTDQWYYADVDYSLYDTVYFAGQTTNNTWDNGETCSITLDKSKIFYRPSDNRDGSLGNGADGREKFNVMNFEKINDWALGFN